MARTKKQRYKDQGIDFIIGQLRKLAKDIKVSPWIRLRAIDRLATIDRSYEVSLIETTPAKLPKPPVEDVPTPATEEPDVEGEQLLDEFNRKFYNKGEKK